MNRLFWPLRQTGPSSNLDTPSKSILSMFQMILSKQKYSLGGQSSQELIRIVCKNFDIFRKFVEFIRIVSTIPLTWTSYLPLTGYILSWYIPNFPEFLPKIAPPLGNSEFPSLTYPIVILAPSDYPREYSGQFSRAPRMTSQFWDIFNGRNISG